MMPSDVMAIVRKMMAPWVRTIQLAIGRCVLEAIEDDKGIQVAKVSLLEGETLELERFQQYGLTSVPKKDAEGVAVFVGGNRDHGIVISIDDREFRLKNLGEGHVALYDASGAKVHLKNNGEIEVVSTTKVTVTSPLVELATGTLEKLLKGETFQTFFNTHTHTGNLGIPTGPPNVASDPTHLTTKVKAGS